MAEITTDTIKKACAGDRTAFAKIYETFSQMSLSVAYRIVGDMSLAEDIVQEVFLIIYRKLGQFSFRSSLKTWIYRIAVNTSLNTKARTSRDRENQRSFVESAKREILRSRTNQPLQRTDKVQEMLRELSPEQRACIVLRSIEQLSYHEISEVLEININTVRSRIKRAREIRSCTRLT